MFKSILNKSSNDKQRNAESDSIGTQKASAGSISSATTKSSTLSAVVMGRKKLSSMMHKLRKSSRRLRFNKTNMMNGDGEQPDIDTNQNRLPYQFDSDEDEYKSADEGTELEIQEEDTLEAKRLMPIDVSKRASCSKKYSIDSDKFVLPEEQCDIPTFLHTKNCDRQLIDETRRLLRERYAKNPNSFYDHDYERMLNDDWTVSRFLLRRRLDPKRTAKLMEECGRFRKQYKMSEVELWEFPIEFHIAGGLFQYAPDRVGNVTMYMRVKMYRRVPEISDVFKAFILCVLERCDVANNGRGTAVVFDLSGCGLQNVDLGFLSWLLSSFRNYCPKGVSYIIVYNLPWILNATCKIAMTWMSASNRRALRFVHGDEIENFIERRNLPDYLGGTCNIKYNSIPEGSRPAVEVCDRMDISKEQAMKIRELFKEYLTDDYDKIISEKTAITQKFEDSKSNYDDAKSGILHDNVSELSAASHQGHAIYGTCTTSGPTTTTPTTNHHRRNSTVPVVNLVSQASRFIAHS